MTTTIRSWSSLSWREQSKGRRIYQANREKALSVHRELKGDDLKTAEHIRQWLGELPASYWLYICTLQTR